MGRGGRRERRRERREEGEEGGRRGGRGGRGWRREGEEEEGSQERRELGEGMFELVIMLYLELFDEICLRIFTFLHSVLQLQLQIHLLVL